MYKNIKYNNSPSQRRVRSWVASLLSLRSSEPPSRRLVARPRPPRPWGSRCPGDASRSLWGLLLDVPRPPQTTKSELQRPLSEELTFSVAVSLIFHHFSTSNKCFPLEPARAAAISVISIPALKSNKNTSQNTTKIINKCSQNLSQTDPKTPRRP